ncbi:Mpp10 protein [Basidiobolus meristosporus CBS 931.73]|uniref:Mpp10 protein n=1 Tax=Basidiobolus meristosporus CBS 931.73 TaxID=1314790 RepID=A0A1Y1XRN5_9FUNG|nr:Mpp10 protein [Basidiobolus meristosporus CBS 931.73]|eukprot:ORX88418.1 Mpp10 protein [Basidiobolus meristosporus CBS 931.73]
MTESLKNPSEELLLSFVKEVVDKPEIFISQNPEVASKVTVVVKNLYDTAKKHEPLPLGPIPELLTEGFDYEQIWEEIQLQNQPLLEYVDTQLEELQTEQDQAISDSEGSDMADSDAQVPEVSEDEDMSVDEDEAANQEVEEEEEEEAEEDLEEEDSAEENDNSADDNIDPERSEIDDEFFSLSQMEAFTEKAEEMELQENSDEEDEIDYFADPDELSDSEEEGTNANDITYGEFFKDGKKRPSKASASNDKKKVRFAGNDDAKEGGEQDEEEAETNTRDLFEQDDDEDNSEDGEKLSSFEKHQRKIQETISQLEEENVADKDWTLKGEASVKTRPMNSLLEEDLEFDHASKPAPVITQEVTETLEDMIKRRIIDNLFDDVQRKKDPNLPAFKPSKMVELNDEKSKKSLSELYEEEYVKQTTGHVVNEKDEALKKTHDEIDEMFKDLCHKLDSLSNFHFTPKMPKAEITVISDAPAISMEEVTPVNVSDANLLAPEEVYEKPSQKKNRKKKSNN